VLSGSFVTEAPILSQVKPLLDNSDFYFKVIFVTIASTLSVLAAFHTTKNFVFSSMFSVVYFSSYPTFMIYFFHVMNQRVFVFRLLLTSTVTNSLEPTPV